MTNTNKHFGYWVFGKDMENVNLKTLSNNGVTDIFLNFYALTAHGESKVLSWIKSANTNKINVHIWTQCFYDGEWHNPKTTNLTAKLKEIKKYANLDGVTGVHLDYLRYPGNAYKTEGGADAITNFVKTVRSQNPKTFLSCAVMPEQSDKYYYGQDIDALGEIVDAMIPMQYKGNYGAGITWLESTTKLFASKATLWSGLQTYKSDNDTTQLSSSELLTDVKTCLNNGAKGVMLFRYGVSPNINFTSFNPTTNYIRKIKEEDKMKYVDILQSAYAIKNSVEKKYELGKSPKWSYYFAKCLIEGKKDVKDIKIYNADEPTGNNLSRQVKRSVYLDMAKRFTEYVEKNHQLPNYITVTNKKMRVTDYTYMFANILVVYSKTKALPKIVEVNSKAFVKPTEPANEVLAYFQKKTGIKLTCIDDFCDWCRDKVTYEFYYDDYKSNKEVINSKAGNCTDLSQLAVNIGEGLGYNWKIHHVRCNQSGTGHVYPLFRKSGVNGGEYFARDVACIADESRYCVWCEAGDGGSLLAVNPSWFLQNKNR